MFSDESIMITPLRMRLKSISHYSMLKVLILADYDFYLCIYLFVKIFLRSDKNKQLKMTEQIKIFGMTLTCKGFFLNKSVIKSHYLCRRHN